MNRYKVVVDGVGGILNPKQYLQEVTTRIGVGEFTLNLDMSYILSCTIEMSPSQAEQVAQDIKRASSNGEIFGGTVEEIKGGLSVGRIG